MFIKLPHVLKNFPLLHAHNQNYPHVPIKKTTLCSKKKLPQVPIKKNTYKKKKKRALLHVQSACNEASIYILLTAVVVTRFQQVKGLKLVLVTRFVGKYRGILEENPKEEKYVQRNSPE